MRISDWSSDVCSSDLRTGASDGCPCGLNQHRTGMARSLFGAAPMPGGAVSRLMHAGVQSKESNETCRAGKAIEQHHCGQPANCHHHNADGDSPEPLFPSTYDRIPRELPPVATNNPGQPIIH